MAAALQKLMGLLLNKQHAEAVFWDTATQDLKQTNEIPSSAGSQPSFKSLLLTYSTCLHFQALKRIQTKHHCRCATFSWLGRWLINIGGQQFPPKSLAAADCGCCLFVGLSFYLVFRNLESLYLSSENVQSDLFLEPVQWFDCLSYYWYIRRCCSFYDNFWNGKFTTVITTMLIIQLWFWLPNPTLPVRILALAGTHTSLCCCCLKPVGEIPTDFQLTFIIMC